MCGKLGHGDTDAQFSRLTSHVIAGLHDVRVRSFGHSGNPHQHRHLMTDGDLGSGIRLEHRDSEWAAARCARAGAHGGSACAAQVTGNVSACLSVCNHPATTGQLLLSVRAAVSLEVLRSVLG